MIFSHETNAHSKNTKIIVGVFLIAALSLFVYVALNSTDLRSKASNDKNCSTVCEATYKYKKGIKTYAGRKCITSCTAKKNNEVRNSDNIKAKGCNPLESDRGCESGYECKNYTLFTYGSCVKKQPKQNCASAGQQCSPMESDKHCCDGSSCKNSTLFTYGTCE